MSRCDTYDFGECTWGACQFAPWVPEHLGNATDWAANAGALGYQLTLAPTVGAVVVYAAGGGYSSFGHVGVVAAVYGPGSFLVHEMNFAAWDVYDDRVSSLGDVEAFVLPPGVGPNLGGGSSQTGGGPGSADDVRIAWGQLQGWLNGGAEDDVARLQAAIALAQQLGG